MKLCHLVDRSTLQHSCANHSYSYEYNLPNPSKDRTLPFSDVVPTTYGNASDIQHRVIQEERSPWGDLSSISWCREIYMNKVSITHRLINHAMIEQSFVQYINCLYHSIQSNSKVSSGFIWSIIDKIIAVSSVLRFID